MKRALSAVLLGLLLMPVAWAPEAVAASLARSNPGSFIKVTRPRYVADYAAAEAAEIALDLAREQRHQIQRALAARGFDVGPADGSFGPRTRDAIYAWQRGYMSGGAGATGYLNTSQAQSLLEGGDAAGGVRRSIRPRQSSQRDGPSFDETVVWLQETLEYLITGGGGSLQNGSARRGNGRNYEDLF